MEINTPDGFRMISRKDTYIYPRRRYVISFGDYILVCCNKQIFFIDGIKTPSRFLKLGDFVDGRNKKHEITNITTLFSTHKFFNLVVTSMGGKYYLFNGIITAGDIDGGRRGI